MWWCCAWSCTVGRLARVCESRLTPRPLWLRFCFPHPANTRGTIQPNQAQSAWNTIVRTLRRSLPPSPLHPLLQQGCVVCANRISGASHDHNADGCPGIEGKQNCLLQCRLGTATCSYGTTSSSTSGGPLILRLEWHATSCLYTEPTDFSSTPPVDAH